MSSCCFVHQFHESQPSEVPFFADIQLCRSTFLILRIITFHFRVWASWVEMHLQFQAGGLVLDTNVSVMVLKEDGHK